MMALPRLGGKNLPRSPVYSWLYRPSSTASAQGAVSKGAQKAKLANWNVQNISGGSHFKCGLHFSWHQANMNEKTNYNAWKLDIFFSLTWSSTQYWKQEAKVLVYEADEAASLLPTVWVIMHMQHSKKPHAGGLTRLFARPRDLRSLLNSSKAEGRQILWKHHLPSKFLPG